jgi:hypothetical protein
MSAHAATATLLATPVNSARRDSGAWRPAAAA